MDIPDNGKQTVKLYLFEAKDHPINDECRKYKIQLLAYSSLAYFLLLFLQGREITSFLGIKIDPGVSSLTVACALCFVIAYYMFVYKLTLQESINSWLIKSGSKSSTNIKEQNISDTFDFIPSTSLVENNSKAIAALEDSNKAFYKIDRLVPKDWREESIEKELRILEQFITEGNFKNSESFDYESLNTKYGYYFQSLTEIAKTYQKMQNHLEQQREINQRDLEKVRYQVERLNRFYEGHQPDLFVLLPLTKQVHQQIESLVSYYSRITTTFQQIENERCQVINNILVSNEYLSEQIYRKLDSLSLKRSFINETLPYKVIPFGYSSLVILLTMYFSVCPAT